MFYVHGIGVTVRCLGPPRTVGPGTKFSSEVENKARQGGGNYGLRGVHMALRETGNGEYIIFVRHKHYLFTNSNLTLNTVTPQTVRVHLNVQMVATVHYTYFL